MKHRPNMHEHTGASRALFAVYWAVGFLLLFASLFGAPTYDADNASPSFQASSGDFSSAGDPSDGPPAIHLIGSLVFVPRDVGQQSSLRLPSDVAGMHRRDVLRYAPKASPPSLHG